MKRYINSGLLILAAIALSACSNGLQSKSVGVNTGLGAGGGNHEQLEIDTKAAEDAAADAEDALIEAEAVIADLLDKNGNLKIFSGGDTSESSELEAQFIAGKIEEALDKVMARLQIVPQTFDTARAQLAAAMAKLDPNNPLHEAAIDKIMMLMERLDSIDAKLKTVTELVAAKIDMVMDKLDALIARLGTNPLTAILLFEVERVKAVIENFKQQLLAL